MLVDPEEVEAGALLDELSVADGVAVLSLDEPVVPGVELEPVLDDDESLGVVVELAPEPFVASSLRQSSFAVPLSASQRGELPYELVDDPLDEESFDAGP